MNLRQRKRVAAMQHIQRVAVELFRRHGYGPVTIEIIAKAAEVGPASIYRYFGTKDRIVIWDEADEGAVQHLIGEIQATPLPAALERFAAALDSADAPMREMTIARMSLVAGEPALSAQAAQNAAKFGELIAGALAKKSCKDQPAFSDRAAGRAAASLMSVAIEEWVRKGGRVSLGSLVSAACNATKTRLDERFGRE